jgi:hypothetical protein
MDRYFRTTDLGDGGEDEDGAEEEEEEEVK